MSACMFCVLENVYIKFTAMVMVTVTVTVTVTVAVTVTVTTRITDVIIFNSQKVGKIIK